MRQHNLLSSARQSSETKSCKLGLNPSAPFYKALECWRCVQKYLWIELYPEPRATGRANQHVAFEATFDAHSGATWLSFRTTFQASIRAGRAFTQRVLS